jgi:hypothetical protein
MKARRVALVLLAMPMAVPLAAGARDCDVRCLERHANAYLDRLAQHDAAGLPFAPSLVAMENGAPAAPGTGVWREITVVL